MAVYYPDPTCVQDETISLALRSDEIHLWLTFIDEVQESEMLGLYLEMLSDEEHQRQSTLQSKRDRTRYVIECAMVRSVLSRYAPVSPRQWRIVEDAHGRRTIDGKCIGASPISVDISHADRLILLGVTSRQALGVGSENISARVAASNMADRCFSWHEIAKLRALPEALQHDRFLEYWTLKESYLKAQSASPKIHPQWFSFELTQKEDISVSFSPAMDDDPNRWRFWLLRISNELLIAVCAQRVNEIAQRLVSRKIVPLAGEELLTPVVVRRSV